MEGITMGQTEKDLLEAIERMTEEEWQKLRSDMKGDDAIMGLLDVIGEQKGWA